MPVVVPPFGELDGELYEAKTRRLTLRREGVEHEVDLVEMRWADISTLPKGLVAFFVSLFGFALQLATVGLEAVESMLSRAGRVVERRRPCLDDGRDDLPRGRSCRGASDRSCRWTVPCPECACGRDGRRHRDLGGRVCGSARHRGGRPGHRRGGLLACGCDRGPDDLGDIDRHRGLLAHDRSMARPSGPPDRDRCGRGRDVVDVEAGQGARRWRLAVRRRTMDEGVGPQVVVPGDDGRGGAQRRAGLAARCGLAPRGYGHNAGRHRGLRAPRGVDGRSRRGQPGPGAPRRVLRMGTAQASRRAARLARSRHGCPHDDAEPLRRRARRHDLVQRDRRACVRQREGGALGHSGARGRVPGGCLLVDARPGLRPRA